MAVLNRFPTGGGIPDDLNTTPAEVLEGYKFIGSLQDDIEVGTLKITGNANANHVLKDKTFYTIDPKQIMTGIMEVNNVSNLVLSLVSGRNVTVKWTNPIQGLGRPYSGVYVRYQTGSYPTSTTGTQAYKGVGSTSSAGSISQVTLALPNLNTTYYFIVYSYCITSNGELLGTQLKGTIKTGSSQVITIKSTQNYTIPAGYNSVDLFCVGGGGGGGRGNDGSSSESGRGGGGGGGGYTKSTLNVTVSPGQVLVCVVGSGGIANSKEGITHGSLSSITRNGTVLCTADGGISPGYKYTSGYNGGSGGGEGGVNYASNNSFKKGGNGGSNGGNGYSAGDASNTGAGAGKGQGTTTRAFGEANNTLYAGGGGGGGAGAWGSSSIYTGGTGGSGGGGNGGMGNTGSGPHGGVAGGTNTGGAGGGGGGGARSSSSLSQSEGLGGQGGSGIVLIRLK